MGSFIVNNVRYLDMWNQDLKSVLIVINLMIIYIIKNALMLNAG